MYNKKDMTAPGIGYQDLRLMQGYPPPREKQVGLHNWDSPPYNRWSFQHMSQLFPVAAIHRSPGPVTELERNERSLNDVRFQRVDGGQTDLATFLTDSYTDGFLVLHQGKVVSEQYFNGMQPHTLHLLQSVSKTVVGSLVGRLIGQGKIDPQARVSDYVPELSASGYGDARVQDLLDMRTGVRFREDYTDPDAEFIQLDIASGWRERGERESPDSIYGLLKSLSKDREHGQFFEYRSVDSDMLAWVCERACGERLPVLLSREIWSRLGAEQDASITLDCVGTALADGGMSATLRDLGRFAQMYLQVGVSTANRLFQRNLCAHAAVVPHRLLKSSMASMSNTFLTPPIAISAGCWTVSRVPIRRAEYLGRVSIGIRLLKWQSLNFPVGRTLSMQSGR
ncbi:serine hydrolase [Pseudomonas corrugata]